MRNVFTIHTNKNTFLHKYLFCDCKFLFMIDLFINGSDIDLSFFMCQQIIYQMNMTHLYMGIPTQVYIPSSYLSLCAYKNLYETWTHHSCVIVLLFPDESILRHQPFVWISYVEEQIRLIIHPMVFKKVLFYFKFDNP